MSTAVAVQYCHILKADKTATQFLTEKEDDRWSQILDYKKTVKIIDHLPFHII